MSGERVQEPSADFGIDAWLRQNTTLPSANRRSLARVLPLLLEQINTDRETVIGISGAPGSGKSTLARALVHCLRQRGNRACRISLDDYYLGLEQRKILARTRHPLFGQRGVPGTHELDRMLADLGRIRSGIPATIRIPVFDKSRDDRAPRSEWRLLDTRPDVVILEGWCIGAPPQNREALKTATNEKERLQDAAGTWRRTVLREWQGMHQALNGCIDQLWYIRVPNWDCVIDWRWRQEQELASKNLGSRSEVADFLACFERIVRHMQDSYTRWADLVLEAGRDHDIRLPDQNERTI